MNNTDNIAATHLGKKSQGSEFYDPSLLVAIPRIENRKRYGIDNAKLPFEGWDIWHAYEFSAMSENGVPVTRLLKIKYNCNSEFIVESKSLKLYLNSFNMSRFGANSSQCLQICKEKIEKDLSNALKTEVRVRFIDNKAQKIKIFNQFENIMDYVDENKLVIKNFKEAPELIEFEKTNEVREYYLTFDSLRSNCRVTHQPDFGDVFIYYKSDKHLKEDSLVKYLCSFRSEYHFHEECCEMIYKRLYDILGGNLFVCALYTRRGGIDISPVRWSEKVEDVEKLLDLTVFARNGVKQ